MVFPGTDHVLSPVLFNGMITGPFWPAGAMWIWAAGAFRVVVCTPPVTVLSPITAIELTPDAWVFTGGTSGAPASVRPVVDAALSIRAPMSEHPLTKTIAAAATPAT